jgi:hypothetical protein
MEHSNIGNKGGIMKRISGVTGLALFFLFSAAGSLLAQQTSTAGQIFDNSRPATGQGNELSTAKIPVNLPPPPPTVQGAPVQKSSGTATTAKPAATTKKK